MADAIEVLQPPSFLRLGREGIYVRRMRPVNPTVTSSAHATLLTGQPPERTGVVANQFHRRGTPIHEIARGNRTDIEVETLIEAARRNGKQVGVVLFPTVDAMPAAKRPQWGLMFSTAHSRGRVQRLGREDFRSDWVPPGWTRTPSRHPSFSPVMRATLTWDFPDRFRREIQIVAYDTTDDRTRNYDSVRVETEDGNELTIERNGWFALRQQQPDGIYGSWWKIQQWDPTLGSIAIYSGTISKTEGYPEAFRQQIESEVGFWPGSPDGWLAGEWMAGREGIDSETFRQQGERLSAFLQSATALAMARMPFDLLLVYQPVIDQVEHQFGTFLHAGRMPAHLRVAATNVLRSAYASFDATVADIAGRLDGTNDLLVVTGDHGLSPVDYEVRINRILSDSGFVSLDERGPRNDTRWYAYASGAIAHLYRFGTTDDSDRLVQHLRTLTAPDGTGIFELVRKRTTSDHPNSGDIIAYAYPRYALAIANGQPFVQPSYFGQHGALNRHRQFDVPFLAWGAGADRAVFDSAEQTAVAPFVAEALGITLQNRQADPRSK